ncbi:MAG: PAS domain S-box protein, partial [Tolypothrix sp. Co-bin9]|nr:PAS domain S-box protein [Tolypothrix sp. Co-bin9]
MYLYPNINLAPEATFNDLVRLAAYLCQTPVALLCLNDGKRRWLKSQVGIKQADADSYLELCIETLLQPDYLDSPILVVQDALVEPRFAVYDLVASLQQVRFYTGVPLITPQGILLGVLSLIDQVPRGLTLQQQDALLALSIQAVCLITGYANTQLEARKNINNLHRKMSKRPLVEKSGQVSHQELVDITLAIDETTIVSITDFTGKIQYVNDKFCEISKYSKEELQEVDHRLINSGYHPPEFFKQMWGTIRRGKVWQGEIRNRAKDGKIYWMDTTIVPILQTQGKCYKYVSICKDITEHKQAEEERICLGSNGLLHLPLEDKNTRRSRSNTYKKLLQSEANMSRSHLSGSDNSFREAHRFFRFSPEMLCIVGF